MQIDIDVSEFLTAAQRMGTAANGLNAELQKAVDQAADMGAIFARANLAANGSIVTRGLYESVEGRPGGGTAAISAEYGPDEDYPGRWVEYGRKPLFAPPGSKMKFQIKGAGPYLYRQSVKAAKPRPFMGPTVARLRPIANQLIQRAVQAALSKA